MATIQDSIFHNRHPDDAKLAAYGFTHENDRWQLKRQLIPGFTLIITITGQQVTTTVIDDESGDPYVLHLDPANSGLFVGQIRDAYIAALEAIAAECFAPTTFAAGQMQALIASIAERYHEQPEFLWPKFPNNAIIRRADNRKWYALLVKLTPDKLGLAGTEPIDVLVARADPETITAKLADGTALPAYHMNKKHWLSYRLDTGIPIADLMTTLAGSRELAK
ncbi:MmcQ/YjbR family DNA-binding protein [Lacticaseibacillus sp. GG6-2]